LAEPKVKSKKMSPTEPVKEEEKPEAKVEVESRSENEKENLGKASPKDISDTHLGLSMHTVPLAIWIICGTRRSDNLVRAT
jgi:hypothetical protein